MSFQKNSVQFQGAFLWLWRLFFGCADWEKQPRKSRVEQPLLVFGWDEICKGPKLPSPNPGGKINWFVIKLHQDWLIWLREVERTSKGANESGLKVCCKQLPVQLCMFHILFMAVVIVQYLDRLVCTCNRLAVFEILCIKYSLSTHLTKVWSSLVSHHFYVRLRLQIWRLYDLDCDSWHWFLDENQSVKHLISSPERYLYLLISQLLAFHEHWQNVSTSAYSHDHSQQRMSCVAMDVHSSSSVDFMELQNPGSKAENKPRVSNGCGRLDLNPLHPLQGLWCRLHVLSFQDWIKIGIDIKRSQTIWRRCPSSVASVRTFHSASQWLGFFRKCQEAWPTENGHGSFRMSSGFSASSSNETICRKLW